MLRVRLLGDIAAERDGEPVPLSGPHRRLLAFLALHPGSHERDALAARIWPDLPTARANLRTAWQLAEDGDGTGITLRVTAAEPKAPVLAEKRLLLAASVVALAALAEREHGPAG